MRSTFKTLLYINRNKIKADGTTAVLCRITIDGKNTVLSTGVSCSVDDWSSKNGGLKDVKANKQLMAFRNRIEQAYEQILRDTGIVSAELLKNTLTGIHSAPTTLLKAGEEERERLRVRSLEINSTST